MSRSSRDEADRRRSPRFLCGGHALLNGLPSSGLALRGRLRDLSLGGCCLDTVLPAGFGARAEVVLRVNAASFRALGEIRDVRGPSVASMEFLQLSSGGKEMLADLIADLARRNAAINSLKTGRSESDEAFARRLKRVDPDLFSLAHWRSVPQLNATVESGRDESAETNIVAAGPLIVTVDVFG